MNIKVLPDVVANQIAAGEVVQRPASVVKELLENSIDSGSKNISLYIKDAGKSLIQVIDDGSGMSPEDAELCVKRHATSKISKIEDIFGIHTMGFRGEALASISAVSHFELKTRRKEDELGFVLSIDGTGPKKSSQSIGKPGTSVSVKNLFYNVPARRNFLKSNNVESRHIIETFQQIALTHPEIGFSLYNNDNETYVLKGSNFKQRIVMLFGKRFDERLVPVKEETEIVTISGYVGKPEFASSKKGEQYFIVNNRFIKSPYLNHAVMQAYDELLSKESFPQYFIQLSVDPSQIDVNIHPTKTEIKFLEERSIYAILRTIIRQSLGKYNIAPSLDFNRESVFDQSFDKEKSIKIPTIKVDTTYNPFNTPTKNVSPFEQKQNYEALSKMYQSIPDVDENEDVAEKTIKPSKINLPEENKAERARIIQLHNKFILTHIRSGFMVIDQHRAHIRVLFEDYLNRSKNATGSQQLLFPVSIDVSVSDMDLVSQLSSEIESLGFSINMLGKDSIAINGVPPGCAESDAGKVFLEMIEAFKSDIDFIKNQTQEKLAMALAKKMAIKPGIKLNEKELENLVDKLFACEMPYHLPNSKPIIITIPLDELNKRFNY
ncbi:MAG TPA: DNA mismatch repair endonuclease MutL [Flavobacteriales bacterium]|nr:DNA mismatch repair endonuclease MutL [Flavobacteriales bacterium]